MPEQGDARLEVSENTDRADPSVAIPTVDAIKAFEVQSLAVEKVHDFHPQQVLREKRVESRKFAWLAS